jgi:hypothetical protein
MIWERRELMRGIFKRSGCIDQYSPSLKTRAAALVAPKRGYRFC